MKITKIILSILFICFVFTGTFNTAKAAEYESKEFSYAFSWPEKIYSEGSNIVILKTDDDCYDSKNKKTCTKIIMDIIAENGSSKRKEFVCKNKNTYAFKLENNTLYTTVKSGDNKIILQIRNKKGKIKQSYPIEINKNMKISKLGSIRDIAIKNSKIYYVLSGIDKKGKSAIYLQCYNLKKKKVISSKKMKDVNSFYEFNNNKLYSYSFEGTTIEEYNLKGKKTVTYKLPAGDTTIKGLMYGLTGPEYEYGMKSVDYNGKYIYYLNRNGVYRCDTKGDGTFELIYDGSNDVVFNPETGQEKELEYFEVFNDDRFLIVVCDSEQCATREFIYEKR